MPMNSHSSTNLASSISCCILLRVILFCVIIVDIHMLTFRHDTHRHENCRLQKNHMEISHWKYYHKSTIVNATEQRGPPKAVFYASLKININRILSG